MTTEEFQAPELNSFCAHIPIVVTWIVSSFILFLLYGHVVILLFLSRFDDVALTPGEATMIIHNYEVRTGHVVSMTELESGYLKGRLCSKDYDIKQWVSQYK